MKNKLSEFSNGYPNLAKFLYRLFLLIWILIHISNIYYSVTTLTFKNTIIFDLLISIDWHTLIVNLIQLFVSIFFLSLLISAVISLIESCKEDEFDLNKISKYLYAISNYVLKIGLFIILISSLETEIVTQFDLLIGLFVIFLPFDLERISKNVFEWVSENINTFKY